MVRDAHCLPGPMTVRAAYGKGAAGSGQILTSPLVTEAGWNTIAVRNSASWL